MRIYYWSDSKFAAWLRNKAHWITTTFLDQLQDLIYFPKDRINHISIYCRNVFDQSHLLRSDLPVGKFAEYDTKLLHGMFEELIRFVEEESSVNDLLFDISLKGTRQAEISLEILTLYTWWKFLYEKEDCEDIINEMQDRLYFIRHHIWS